MKSSLYIILFVIFLTGNSYSQVDFVTKPKILVFNKIGQIENVNQGENVSIVFGPAIKTEYAYISYSNGKKNGEYLLELKSKENLFKEIYFLKSSVDSLKLSLKNIYNENLSKDNKIAENIENTNNYSDFENNNNLLLDSLQHESEERDKLDVFSKIPKISNSRESDLFIINSNKKTINENNLEISRNKNRIDTLLKVIEDSKISGKNLDQVNDYYKEIDSLRLRNSEIEKININLKYNNALLSGELRIKNAEYDSLIRLIYLISAIALLVILIAVFIYINYRQKRKFNIELNRINSELELINQNLDVSNKEKDKLLKIIRKELNTASGYVVALLPKKLKSGNIHTDWFYKPSTELGGDAFGYKQLDADNFAIYLLDVSGHGVGASLHSVQILNILNNQNIPNIDFRNPDDVLNSLNRLFLMDKFNGMYFTICYAVYNSKSKKLKYASAGHPPMVLISGNKVNSLESQNIFIGAVVNSEYSSDEIIINPNDTLFLFSDGVFEFEKSSQEMYTFDNFKRDLNKGICLEKNGLEKLYENAKNICSRKELEDDFSIVKIQFLK